MSPGVTRQDGRESNRPTTILHGGQDTDKKSEVRGPGSSTKGTKSKPYCPFCNNQEHYLSQRAAVSRLNQDQLTEWTITSSCTVQPEEAM